MVCLLVWAAFGRLSSADGAEVAHGADMFVLGPLPRDVGIGYLGEDPMQALLHHLGEGGAFLNIGQRFGEELRRGVDAVDELLVTAEDILVCEHPVQVHLQGDLRASGVRITKELVHYLFCVTVIDEDVIILNMAGLVVDDTDLPGAVAVNTVGEADDLEPVNLRAQIPFQSEDTEAAGA